MSWFVMRDLTRSNSKRPAWMGLDEAGYRYYTPMTWKVRQSGGVKKRVKCPVIHDLLFVQSSREELDPYIELTPTLQYRYKRGGSFKEAMTVTDEEMERFILATTTDPAPIFYQPDEITADKIGKKVRIIGGTLNGYEGNLLRIKGMRKRRLIIELIGMLSVAVEVEPQYIEFL